MEKRVAIVTGAGSGIGAAAAGRLREKGWTVYDFSRRDRAPQGVTHISCDVADSRQVERAVETVWAREGRLDAVINNAGFGISGAIEFTPAAEARGQMDVNLFGMDHIVRAVLPLMRGQGSGRVINISSVAAELPVPFQAWYSASKAAISAYSLALRNEVKPFGISVTCLMPGDIATGFTAARHKEQAGNEIYAGRIERAVSAMERDETNGISPEVAGKLLARLAEKKWVKATYVVGGKYRAFLLLKRLLPTTLVNWAEGKLYG